MEESMELEAYRRNPDLGSLVEVDTELKNWLVEYVGNKLANDSPDVTVEMIVETLAEEFPDFLMVVAEENWLRGYRQGIHDVEAGMLLAQQEGHEIPFLHPPAEASEEE